MNERDFDQFMARVRLCLAVHLSIPEAIDVCQSIPYRNSPEARVLIRGLREYDPRDKPKDTARKARTAMEIARLKELRTLKTSSLPVRVAGVLLKPFGVADVLLRKKIADVEMNLRILINTYEDLLSNLQLRLEPTKR